MVSSVAHFIEFCGNRWVDFA